MFIRGDEVLHKIEGEKLIYPTYGECNTDGVDVRYLFSVDETQYFLAFRDTYKKEEPAYDALLRELEARGFEFANRMKIRYTNDKTGAFAGAVAYQLGRWYGDNRICGRCANKLIHSKTERAMKCEACGNVIYPKICPAVIVAVVDKENVVLTKYAVGSKGFALIAGFAETGETIEETVRREVMEEVGIRVKNLRYYKSQPWVFTDTLLFGFFCEPEDDKKITVDETELSYAQWVPRSEVQKLPDNDLGFSLTYEMINVFKEGREYSF